MERLGIGVNCLWCLAVVVIFMGLGGAKSLVGLGGFKVIIWGRASYRGGGQMFFFFCGEQGGGGGKIFFWGGGGRGGGGNEPL